MSFSDLFDSEFKSRNKGHFSAMVRVAMTDGAISADEKTFLDRLARKFELSDSEYEELLVNPMRFPINPPYLYTQRLERMYDLARIVHVDHHLGNKQELLLRKFALALGFTPANAAYIVDKALKLVEQEVDLETFIYEMQHMNK